jgi:hypothetical protein
MPGEVLYPMLARCLEWTVWGGEVETASGSGVEAPAVIVANHAGALGPIAVTSSLPWRLYPWMVGDMLEFALAPQYLKTDFVEPVLHIPAKWSLGFAEALAQITVRLMRRIECVPVWADKRLMETYELSAKLLAEGKSLLIFPEDPTLSADQDTGMRAFKTGFARVGQFFFELTGQRLRFYPVAVLVRRRRVRIGRAVTFNPSGAEAREWVRVARVLEATIREMILGESRGAYAGIPQPH